jgi:hypothetical protein
MISAQKKTKVKFHKKLFQNKDLYRKWHQIKVKIKLKYKIKYKL